MRPKYRDERTRQKKNNSQQKTTPVNHNESMQAQYYTNARDDSKHTHDAHDKPTTRCERHTAQRERQHVKKRTNASNLRMLSLAQNKIKINKASDVEASAYVHCLCVLSLIYKEQTCTLFLIHSFPFSFAHSLWRNTESGEKNQIPVPFVYEMFYTPCARDLDTLRSHM